MSNWIDKVFSSPLRAAVNADEILTALKHRAAYRAIWILGLLIGTASVCLLNFTTDPMWKTVGMTLAVTFFLMHLIYEGIQAFDGVMKAEDELLARLNLDKSVVYAKVAKSGVLMGGYMVLIKIISNGAFDPVFDSVLGVSTAIVFAWLSYSRWKNAMKTSAQPN